MNARVVLVAAACVAAVLVAPGAAGADVQVGMVDKTFTPAGVEVDPGDVITWRNDDDRPHTVTSSRSGAFSSGHMDVGDVFQATIEEPGTYQYRCLYHGGMVGYVVVRESEPAQEPPPDETPPVEEPPVEDPPAEEPPPEEPPAEEPPAEGNGSTLPPTPSPAPEAAEPEEDGAIRVTLDQAALVQPLSGVVTLTGTAAPASALDLVVEVQMDGGSWRRAPGGAAWSYEWNTTEVADGVHIVAVRALAGGEASPFVWKNVLVTNADGTEGAGAAGDGTRAVPGPGLVVVALAAAVAARRR